jgi:hypothetical protein
MDVLGAFAESCTINRNRQLERSMMSLAQSQAAFDAKPTKHHCFLLRQAWEEVKRDAGFYEITDDQRAATMPAREKARTSVLTFEGKPL